MYFLKPTATFGLCLLAFLWSNCPQTTSAEEAKMKKPRVAVENLDNPSGVAVHPAGHVFFTTNAGVHRLVPNKEMKVYDEVTGYVQDIYGKGPKYDIGPLGLAFLGRNHLVVGGGSRPDGEELVHVYKVSMQPRATPVNEEDAAFTLGPVVQSEETAKGEGNFYGVVASKAGIFVTANGDDTKGWVLKADVKQGKPQELKPGIATKVATGTDAPVAITMDQSGHLVVGQMGEMNLPGDSLLTMYDAESGELLHQYETGLSDIAGLAYSPKTGKLYAVDFSWAAPTDGGLFELIIEDDEVEAKKIVSLEKPTALAFDKRGRLFITVFGNSEEGSEQKPGKLLMLAPGL